MQNLLLEGTILRLQLAKCRTQKLQANAAVDQLATAKLAVKLRASLHLAKDF